jgi:hypothetical protein
LEGFQNLNNVRSLTLLLCIPLLLSIRASAADMKLGPGRCLIVSNLEFTRATGDPRAGQGPHLKGTVQNTCNEQMTLTGTALFLNGKNQVGDDAVVQTVGKGLTATFDAFAITPESAHATTASLSGAEAAQQ